jgi:hypothetical protein
VALDFLARTQEGEQWINNLICHLHGARSSSAPGSDIALPASLEEFNERVPAAPRTKPHIAIDNT